MIRMLSCLRHESTARSRRRRLALQQGQAPADAEHGAEQMSGQIGVGRAASQALLGGSHA